MWYKSGGLSLFSGSKVVLGENTLWADKNNGVSAGSMLLIFADCGIKIYEIASVMSDTELMLSSEYSGCTANGVHYAIPVFGSNDTFDHAAYVAQIAAMLAGYQSQLTQWKQVLTERGQVTLTDNSGQSVVVKTLPDLTDAVSRMMDKTLNGADIPDKAQFVANLGLSDVVHKSDLANHTHTASQITDFTDAVRKVLVATLAAGQGVSLNYDTTNNQLVVSATGSNSGGGNSDGGNSSGGRDYTVVTQSITAVTSPVVFRINNQTTYAYDAYALKEEVGSKTQVQLDDFGTNSASSYSATGDVIFDGALRSYANETLNTTQDGAFYSTPIRSAGKDVSFDLITDSLVSGLTSATSMPGVTVSQSSSAKGAEVVWQGWYAFDNNQQTIWSSEAPLPQWLSVSFSDLKTLTFYSISPSRFGGGVSPRSWKIQGSNDGGVTWTDVDARTGISWGSSTQTFRLAAAVQFKAYRFYCTAVNGQTDNTVAIADWVLFNDAKKFLLLADDGSYYTAANGTLTQVAAPTSAADITATGFASSGKITEATLAGKKLVKLVSDFPASCRVVYTSYPQIAIQKLVTTANSWSSLVSVVPTYTQSGSGNIRVAVSRNGNDWSVWNGSAWTSIGALTADTASAAKLLSSGTSLSSIAAITAAQWALLYSNNSGIPDAISFAFAIDMPIAATDVANIDNLSLTITASAWKLQTPAEVEIRWYRDQVTFKPASTGNYKFAYQHP
ncbi:discoidin domain-containing protein [Dickeya oryzae]|uniref:Discoidin domain-containing protein n=1 Tax=Dickeya oryzae TaxID=1240404 RepID=A0AB39IYL9_9GAMM|nr:discoidin domain-containing protein [Dickeya oryzae]MBP2859251.1 discoidin domain-containing protein [Dickeya oryzae]MCA6993118.1 discoidin domain-containing protein [Dickeya oryzae]